MQTRWKKATEKKASVKTDVIIATTSVVKEIVEYAEKSKIDMIVIGSRDMTGFKKLLLGSVAGAVVTYPHCPVLVVIWLSLWYSTVITLL